MTPRVEGGIAQHEGQVLVPAGRGQRAAGQNVFVRPPDPCRSFHPDLEDERARGFAHPLLDLEPVQEAAALPQPSLEAGFLNLHREQAHEDDWDGQHREDKEKGYDEQASGKCHPELGQDSLVLLLVPGGSALDPYRLVFPPQGDIVHAHVTGHAEPERASAEADLDLAPSGSAAEFA